MMQLRRLYRSRWFNNRNSSREDFWRAFLRNSLSVNFVLVWLTQSFKMNVWKKLRELLNTSGCRRREARVIWLSVRIETKVKVLGKKSFSESSVLMRENLFGNIFVRVEAYSISIRILSLSDLGFFDFNDLSQKNFCCHKQQNAFLSPALI